MSQVVSTYVFTLNFPTGPLTIYTKIADFFGNSVVSFAEYIYIFLFFDQFEMIMTRVKYYMR